MVIVWTLLFIINIINANWLENSAAIECPECNNNNEINDCIANEECVLLANLFQNASSNDNNNNGSSMSIIDIYLYYYLNWCGDNGQYGFDCKNNAFDPYFECAALQQNCYNFTQSKCETEFAECMNDPTFDQTNCIQILNQMNDFNDYDIFNDGWMKNILSDTIWDWSLQEPEKYKNYEKFIDLISCVYNNNLINNETCIDDPSNDQFCSASACIQQEYIMDCAFDIRCGLPLMYFNGGNDIIPIIKYNESCADLRICNNKNLKQTIHGNDYLDFQGIFNNFTNTFNNILYPQNLALCSINNITNDNNDENEMNECLNNKCSVELKACNNDFWVNINVKPGQETVSLCNDTQFCPGQCSSDINFIANIQNKYGVKTTELYEMIKEYYCKYKSLNTSKCNGNNDEYLGAISECYIDECFAEQTQNLLCINTNCSAKIGSCLLDSGNDECGDLYLDYLERKQLCYNSYYVSSGLERCQCKQEGDPNDYYDLNSFSDYCINGCKQCDQESYHYINNKCSSTTTQCPQPFLDIFSCIFENCTAEYNEYYKPNNTKNIINDIDSCEYNKLCADLLTLCWSDAECFNAFFTNFDGLMDVLLNNFRMYSNNNLFQTINFNIANTSIAKYHCGISPIENYDNNDGGIVCNHIFFNLIECILDECIYVNEGNCIWSSCSDKLNSCVGFFTTEPAKCNQALYWLSTSYDDLEYIKYIDNQDIDTSNIDCDNSDNNNINQCYYYNVVGYCVKNGCPSEFWDVVHCIFQNNCIGNDDDKEIDYSLSGTTQNLFDGDACIYWQTNFYFYSYDTSNICKYDLYQLLYCGFRLKEDNSTLYTKNITSDSYGYFQSIDVDCNEQPLYNGSLYIYADCINQVKDAKYIDYGFKDVFMIRTYLVYHNLDSLILMDSLSDGGYLYQRYYKNNKLAFEGPIRSWTDYWFSQSYTFGDCDDRTKVPSSARDWINPYPTPEPSSSPTEHPTTEPTEQPSFIISTITSINAQISSSSPNDAESAEANNREGNVNVGLIAGIISAVVVVIVFVIGIGYWLKLRKSRKESIQSHTIN